MPSIINTNVASLNAQRNLNTSQNQLSTALQRLSSGLRINSAKDDAAGLAISNRMSAQIGGMQQAARNANDAISMAQTAEGAMQSVGDILLRMRDLAVQSANDTNSASDRSAIQNEMDQLTAEIDRISSTTEFNGVKLLNGSASNRTFQVGANANQTIGVSINELSTKTLALNANQATGDLNSGRIAAAGATTGDLVINGTSVTFAGTDNSIKEFKDAINAVSGNTGVTASAYNIVEGTAGATGVTGGALTIQVDAADGTAGAAITIDASANMSELVSNINKQVGGITASIGSKGQLVLSNDTGGAITIGGTVGGSGLSTNGATAYQGYLSLKSGTGQAITLSTATGTAASALNKFGFNASAGNNVISSSPTATASVANIAAAMTSLNTNLGAITATDDIKINGVKLGTSGASASEKAAAINAISNQTGVTATAETKAYLVLDFAKLGANNLVINGTSIAFATTDDNSAAVTKINAAGIGVTATADATTGRVVLSSSGNDLTIGSSGASGSVSVATSASGTATATGVANNVIGVRGSLTLTGQDGASVRLEGANVSKLGLVAQGGNSEAVGGKLSVTTVANATAAIDRIDAAIQSVSTLRSTMGAVQNRFSTTISNLQTTVENLSASRSRIQDADFAAETATLTRAQILQQAGTAMLAQANALPQQVLTLLR